MSDDLARRMADGEIAEAIENLARDARRLAEMATQYADSITSSPRVGDEARRLTRYATSLLLDAARLDGMRRMAPLVPGATDPERAS